MSLYKYFTFCYFLTAAYISLAPVIVVDLVGLEKLTNGFGLICMVRGITAILGPPIEGILQLHTLPSNAIVLKEECLYA